LVAHHHVCRGAQQVGNFPLPLIAPLGTNDNNVGQGQNDSPIRNSQALHHTTGVACSQKRSGTAFGGHILKVKQKGHTGAVVAADDQHLGHLGTPGFPSFDGLFLQNQFSPLRAQGFCQ